MEKILRKVYNSKKISSLFQIVSMVAVIASALVYAVTLYFAFKESIVSCIKVLLFAGIPFILVDLSRRLINAKRPYEVYTFYEKPPKNKKGNSFPSRHAYSVFVIGVLSFSLNPFVGIAILCLGLALCICRVLLGIHFIRDVIAGALIGIISGVCGLIFM